MKLSQEMLAPHGHSAGEAGVDEAGGAWNIWSMELEEHAMTFVRTIASG